ATKGQIDTSHEISRHDRKHRAYSDALEPDQATGTNNRLTQGARPLSPQEHGLRRRPPMSVLVTGGAGYIGSHMLHELLEAGETVIVIARLSTGFEWAVPSEAELVVGDIGDTALIASLIETHDVD